MTEKSRPWAGVSIGDSGPYSDAQWRDAWKNMFGAGGYANAGPLLGSGTQPNDGLLVQAQSPAANKVNVLAGAALVQGAFYLNDATVALTIAANSSGNPRVDTIILRMDFIAQTVRLAVLQGTPAASPVAATLTQTAGVQWEVPLAYISVANAFSTILASDVQPAQQWANASPGVYVNNVLNNSGAELNTGDVVVQDTSADRAATTTTVLDNPQVWGVWVGRTPNGGYGQVQVRGIGYVRVSTTSADGAYSRGALIISKATAKVATQAGAGAQGAVIGTAMAGQAVVGPNTTRLLLTYIHVDYVKFQAYLRFLDQKANNTAAASLTLGAWRTRELTVEEVDSDNLGSLASNQMTLAAGTYFAYCTAQSTVAAGNGRLRLRDTTGGATLLQGNNIVAQSVMILVGVFTIQTQSVIELQHYPSATGTGGTALNSGDNEVYAEVFLVRVGRYS